ncbi:monooxygenase [Enterovirga aerilata]|uniref:Monooxygenase n=1 Tax=Enterovirga aerilata TaxID=2730920 RepID=A0A849IAN1_9HYPH|nr:monooxygenase [Enterovirga sp. DB1703]NNM71013.1 monooxygenase [Enterovirga sp. DB1703]
MIVEIVTFKHRPGQSREEVLEEARATVPKWQANPDLIRKHFLYGQDDAGGGIYLWPSREAAEAAHGPEWREGVRARTGSEPQIVYYDLLMVIDNERKTVAEP